MATFVNLGHPVTILVTYFTNLTNELLILNSLTTKNVLEEDLCSTKNKDPSFSLLFNFIFTSLYYLPFAKGSSDEKKLRNVEIGCGLVGIKSCTFSKSLSTLVPSFFAFWAGPLIFVIRMLKM